MAREPERSHLDRKMTAYLEEKWPGITQYVSKYSITGGAGRYNELHLTLFFEFIELENAQEKEG